MRWEPFIALPVAIVSTSAAATVYMTAEQAQQAMFPGASFHKVPFALSPTQRDALRERTGVRDPFNEDGVWSTGNGGFFIVDRVIGKHEWITYAVGIDHDGTVKRVEVLEYRENYGSAIRNQTWCRQFVGKSAASPVRLDQDVASISGATLSARHVTDGVRRVLAVYDMALKGLRDGGR